MVPTTANNCKNLQWLRWCANSKIGANEGKRNVYNLNIYLVCVCVCVHALKKRGKKDKNHHHDSQRRRRQLINMQIVFEAVAFIHQTKPDSAVWMQRMWVGLVDVMSRSGVVYIYILFWAFDTSATPLQASTLIYKTVNNDLDRPPAGSIVRFSVVGMYTI